MGHIKRKIKTADDKTVAMRVSVVSIVVNCFLSLFKLAAGIFAGSGAMISDALHSASDVFSTVIVMIGVTEANKKSDKEHPYGHERMECVASILLAVVLFITGTGIGLGAVEKMIKGISGSLLMPKSMALAAAAVSIWVKEWMYWYTRAAAKRINSSALMADAWHHRSDALSSIGAFAGIFGARMGFPVLDPAASLVICLFIVKAAIDIFLDSTDKMVDKSCDDRTIAQMTATALKETGVCRVDEIRTRMFGSRIYVDIEIAADSRMDLSQAHQIANNVHDAIEAAFLQVKHCMVYVRPLENRDRDC